MQDKRFMGEFFVDQLHLHFPLFLCKGGKHLVANSMCKFLTLAPEVEKRGNELVI
jgi:hypothetical protein